MKGISERRRALSEVPLPDDLPVARHASALIEAIRNHAVTVVAGETGSGKSTLLPRLAASARPDLDSRIAITQPRRVAARAIASRISSDLGAALGNSVGYRTRFESSLAPTAPLVAITDGLLLQDLRRDRDLRTYDTIIVDEVHERSVAIDFLLGILAGLVRRRPDLRVVLSSATIDVERLSHHFMRAGVSVATHRVEGRLHPVEIRWVPTEEEDLLDGCARALLELVEAGETDCLCFLPGEAEIAQVQSMVEGALAGRVEVLPLYARLSSQEQDRIFTPGPRPRIILATNIAETSVTVPRIRAVVDSGLARVARYSTRSRVMRLPLEPVSQAAARQRTGRAGRLGPGLCVRLCSEEAFAALPAFTEPEIRRTNLAGVLLRMASLRLGAPERFPFVDPPAPRALAEAEETLRELGAIEQRDRLTQRGRRLADMPIDPRLGAALLASIDLQCAPEAAVVTSFLSTADPRVRSHERSPEALSAQAALRDTRSDFATILAIWRAWAAAREAHGSSALKRWCQASGLSHLRLREWQSVHDQLRRELARHGVPAAIAMPQESNLPHLHRALAHGLACSVAERTSEGDYKLPSGQRMTIHPSSVLARGSAKWIVAAEVVDTGRRQARLCGPIRSEWVADCVHHGLRSAIREPHWVPDTGQVAAWKEVHWGALTVVQRHSVPFGPHDPSAARDIMIQAALVEGQFPSTLPFLDHNSQLLERLREEETRRRHAGLVPTESELFRFYDERVPRDIHDWPSLRRWFSAAVHRDPSVLCLSESELAKADPAGGAAPFPDWRQAGASRVPVSYNHAPGERSDGATIHLSAEAFAALPSEAAVRTLFQPLPGHRAELVEGLIRALPKGVRHRLGPITTVADSLRSHLERVGGDMPCEWEAWLRWIGGEPDARALAVSALSAVPRHVLPRLSVAAGSGAAALDTRSPDDAATAWRARRTPLPTPPARPANTSAGATTAAASLSRSAIRHHLEYSPLWRDFALHGAVLGASRHDDLVAACAEAAASTPTPEASLAAACQLVLQRWVTVARAAHRVAGEIERVHARHSRLADHAAEIAEAALPAGIIRSADGATARQTTIVLEALLHVLSRPERADADDPAGWERWCEARRELKRLQLRITMRTSSNEMREGWLAKLAALSDALEWMPVAILAPHLRPPSDSHPTKWRRRLDDLDRDLTIAE